MFWNPIEQEIWKMRVLNVERKAEPQRRTRRLKSPEARLLERLLRDVRLLFSRIVGMVSAQPWRNAASVNRQYGNALD